MKSFIIAVILLVFGAVGCGHAVQPFYYVKAADPGAVVTVRTYHIWVDKEFGESDKLAIDNAVKQWNFALNGYVKLVIDSYQYDMEPDIIKRVMRGEGWIVLKIDRLNPMVDPLDRANSGEKKFYTLAWVNEIGGNRMFVIRDRIANNWMEGIMLHEMGHLLGAEHDDVYLMQPHYNWADYRCVDYEALKRVAKYQVIPMSHLNYCEYGDRVALPR